MESLSLRVSLVRVTASVGHHRLARAAAADLDEIHDYTSDHWGDEKATAYLTELRDRMRLLATAPAQGKDRSDLGKGLFSFLQGSHTIYYRVARDDIEVVRVLHQRMDAFRQF